MDQKENNIKMFNINDVDPLTFNKDTTQQSTVPETPVFDPLLFVNNPGSYEDLHKKTKEIFPVCFEGFKFVLNKQLSSHFQVNHSLTMSNSVQSGYKFGATYIGNKMISQNEVYPIILGDIDSYGNLNANIIHQFTPNLRTRVVAQIQNSKLLGYQCTNDYRAKTFTASLTAVNTNVTENSGILIAQYLQRVTRKLDLGAEFILQYGPTVPGNKIGVYSFAWKYYGNQWHLSGALNPLGSLHLCYFQQSSLSPIQFGVEMEANMRTMESQGTFSYQVDLKKANMTLRGMVDSNWNVGSVIEKRLEPLPFTFILSGFLNHVKSTYKFGIGLTIG